MSTTTTPESTVTVWVDRQSWSAALTQRLDQKLELVAVGAPEAPSETGRRAVDEFSEDLKRLADA